MTSSKVSINSIDENIDSSKIINNYCESNLNKTRNLIALSIAVSKLSQVPMMILGNPGEGKTTTIDDYAEQYGYHVEKLIGSQYSQDDILGFQTNTGKEHLEVLIPNWYKNIMDYEEKGIPTILFLDELVTASTEVQEALLQLTKERTIRDNRKLPDDCVVISAINYKENLPPENNLTSTQLNRFCLINTLPGDEKTDLYAMGKQFVQECVQGFNTREIPDKLPSFESTPFTEEENKDFKQRFGKALDSIFSEYSMSEDSDKGCLDLRNTRYDGMFDGRSSIPEIYNFISKRSVSYLLNVMRALCEIGIRSTDDSWKEFVVGLIGLGTNSWSDDDEIYAKQIKKYHSSLFKRLGGLLDTFSHSNGAVIEEVDNTKVRKIVRFDESELSGKIKDLISRRYSDDISKDDAREKFDNILKEIESKYPTDSESFVNVVQSICSSKEECMSFRSDMEAIKLLKENISEFVPERTESIYASALSIPIDMYKFYYHTCLNGITKEDIESSGYTF